jgi:hypothetical protein
LVRNTDGNVFQIPVDPDGSLSGLTALGLYMYISASEKFKDFVEKPLLSLNPWDFQH